METPKLRIELKQNLKNFAPEIIARIIYLLVSGIVYYYTTKEIEKTNNEQSFFFATLFIFFNIILFLLTLYGTKRRRLSITNFINMRLRAHPVYSKSKIEFYSDFYKTAFYVLVVISSLLFACSIFAVFLFLKIDDKSGSILYPIIVLVVPFIYGFILQYNRLNFISKGIVSISHEDKKFSPDEVKEFMSMLYDEQKELEVYYFNDGLIYEIEQKANIFRQRVETLLIEAVFIGALTFGTFIQLTSPESIGAFEQIDEKEMQLNVNGSMSEFQKEMGIQENQYLKDSIDIKDTAGGTNTESSKEKNGGKVYRKKKNSNVKPKKTNTTPPGSSDQPVKPFKPFKPVKQTKPNNQSTNNTNNQRVENSINLQNTASSRTKNGEKYYFNDSITIEPESRKITKGIFNDWALQRQYAILAPIYILFDNKKNGIFEIIDLGINVELKNLGDSIKALIKKRNSQLESEKKDVGANSKKDTLSSAKTEKLILKLRYQKRLVELVGDNPYKLPAEKRAEVLAILHKYDYDKHLKYYCLTKNFWDEQEYLFLIAIGSIICSVLYISVLIKRFAIILKIESLFSELNVAQAWNRREEDALSNEMRIEVEGGNELIRDKFRDKREYYSEKLQIQLAKCELIGTKIETNIQVASFVRNLGLYTFFIVLLIGTMMLDPRFTFMLSSILIYAMVGSAFMQEGSSIRSIWEMVSGSPKDHNRFEDL